ncbi:MAG: WecB/TagA/CpsF family glycosyltransferase [Actinomycetospora chiangmaiensis]|nr:WecB/TagA/CpsF family glycosyltransferase [Actinomycetospora chiangmaiensis]
MDSDVRTIPVGGLPVAALDRATTARLTIDSAIARRGRNEPCLFFTTTNGQVVSLCASQPEVRTLYGQADLISPDGMSVVTASRLLCREGLPERVATTDAFHDAALLAEETGASFYFLGASESMNKSAVARAQALYPRLKIVGRRNGYFKQDEEAAIIAEINRARPDVLWLGLGVPRQQDFIVRNRAKMTGVGVAKTCGGLFDFLSGKNSRAPAWMQGAGLEWLYRVMLEPRRLFLRYLVTNPHAIYVLATRTGEKHVAAMVASGAAPALAGGDQA